MGSGVYTGPGNIPHVTTDQIRSGEVEAPKNTVPYEVQQGDNLWTIAKNSGYGNPPDMDAFYKQNPEFQQRNPDLIYPGEVVYVAAPENGTATTGKEGPAGQMEYQNYKDGQPTGEPYYAKPGEGGQPANSETVNENGESIVTDDKGQPLNGPRNLGPNQDGTNQYQDYKDGKPVGDSYSSRPGANGEPTTKPEPQPQPQPQVPDTTQAVPGTPLRLGPYSPDYGPYMPNTTVQLKDGSSIRIDDKGYPANGPVDVSTVCYADGHKDMQDYKDGKPVGDKYQVDVDGNRIADPAPGDTKPAALTGVYPATLEGDTSRAADAYFNTAPVPVSPEARSKAKADFIAAVKKEIEAGVSPETIKERYGNYPPFNQAIDQAAAG